MLVQFSVENFRSIKERVTFSMAAYGERIHPHHTVKAKHKNDVSLLRGALLYGANASGKSNFVTAIRYMQKLVIRGRRTSEALGFQTFKLDPKSQTTPTVFEIDFKINDDIFTYGFSLLNDHITEEWLKESGAYKDKSVYHRRTDENGKAVLNFGPWLSQLTTEERTFLQFVSQGTRPNQLFLTETKDRNLDHFNPAWEWFNDKLTVITPDDMPLGLELKIESEKGFASFLQHLTFAADVGISEIKTIQITPEASNLPPKILSIYTKDLTHNELAYLSYRGQRYCIGKNDHGEITLSRLILTHKNPLTGETSTFEIEEESDGTRRLIDLSPALFELSHHKDAVYIIDELGRNLHPQLIAFIKDYHLEQNTNEQSQLIFTTHHPSLLNLQKLRRGEIWFVEKNPHGATVLYSLLEFKNDIRYDKDIQKAYRQGRFGAIPRLSSFSGMSDAL